MNFHDFPHVFLGGVCGENTYRADIAIPVLEKYGISYFNPQIVDSTRSDGLRWSDSRIDIEAEMKNNCPQLLFVVSGDARGTTSILEAVEYVCYGSFVHLVVDEIPDGTVIDGSIITGRELRDLNRARKYLCSVTHRRRKHVPIHATVEHAMISIVKIAAAYGVGNESTQS